MKITKKQIRKIVQEEIKIREGFGEYVKDFFDPHGVFSGAGAGIDEDEIRSIATPDAWVLFKAMGGLGTDEDAIEDVFSRRRNAPGGLIELDQEFDELLQNLKKQRGSARTNIIKGVFGAALNAPIRNKRTGKIDIAGAFNKKNIARTAMSAITPVAINQIQKKMFTGAKKSKYDRVGGLQKWLRDDGEHDFADEVKTAYHDRDQKSKIKEGFTNMRLKEEELRLVIREALISEGKFADIMRGVGKHGSKILTRPAGIIAKVFGRLATSGDTSGYEDRIDSNVKGLESLVGDLLHLPGRFAEVGYEEIKKMVKKFKPDATEEEIMDLQDQIDIEKEKQPSTRRGGFRNMPKAQPLSNRQLAAESRIRKLLKTI